MTVVVWNLNKSRQNVLIKHISQVIVRNIILTYIFILILVVDILSCKLCHHPWFANKQAWKIHLLTCHHSEVVAICEECCKIFKSNTGFTDHNKIYHSSAEEKHQCKVCGKSFISMYKLGMHERSHSSEKPYSCIKCQKSYKYKKDLQNHENSKHTDGNWDFLFNLKHL